MKNRTPFSFKQPDFYFLLLALIVVSVIFTITSITHKNIDSLQQSNIGTGKSYFLKDKLLTQAKTLGEISKKLPFADLVLSQQEKYCQLYQTDDDRYFSQVSARQTHFDVPFRLQKRNWPYRTFYSRQFWQDPQKLLHEIEQTKC